MSKVMVVDDEKWIRRGLIQAIPWDRFGLELVGEAEDGKEAYDLATSVRPDLLFLDMRMPGLDGRELLAQLQRDLPQILTIVVSGYSDFEYTKEAIRHKAFDYLLKPVKKDELAAVLEKASAELARRAEEKRLEASRTAEDWLRALLLQDEASGSSAFRPAHWRESDSYVVIAAQSDVYSKHLDAARLAELLEAQLQRSRPFLLGGAWDCRMTTAEGGVAVAVLHGAQLIRPDLAKLHQALQTAVAESGADAVTVSFGVSVSPTGAGESRLSTAYRECRQALRDRPLGACSAVRFAGDAAAGGGAYPQERENALLLALQMASPGTAKQELDRLFASFEANAASVGQLQRYAQLLLHAFNKQLNAQGSNWEVTGGRTLEAYAEAISVSCDAGSLRELFGRELIPLVVTFHQRSSEKSGEKLVMELKKQMDAGCEQPFSLHEIAAHHFMNPDYLSRIFKKTIGQSFLDYLMDVRIAKAKELLYRSCYKNYEIAGFVGYDDYRYFSQIFKRKTGMTIGEFRKLYGLTDSREE